MADLPSVNVFVLKSRSSVRLQWSVWEDGGAGPAELWWRTTCRSQTHVSWGAGEGHPHLTDGASFASGWVYICGQEQKWRNLNWSFTVCVCFFLGITHTVALWKCLFTLLQDEDQDVRDGAAEFTCYIPTHLHNTGTHGHTLILKGCSGFSAS